MVESLIGQVLIAGPSLQDPNFQRTVIVTCEHNDEGALGIVYNRPSPITVAEALPPLAETPLAGRRLFLGGPVQTENIFVIHDDPGAGSDEICSGLFFGGDPELLDRLCQALKAGDEIEVQLFAGYSGWGAGQLEFEMSQGAWIVAPGNKLQILGANAENKWRQALLDLWGRYAMLADTPHRPWAQLTERDSPTLDELLADFDVLCMTTQATRVLLEAQRPFHVGFVATCTIV